MHALTATPAATSVPPVWLLGSSDYSARLAASRGLPYVFAHHFSGQGTAEALELYRSSFQPSEANPVPRTFLTVNAVVAESQEEADRLALPQLQAMVALRTGQPLRPQRLVEEAEKEPVPAAAPGPARGDVAPLGHRDTVVGRFGDPDARFVVRRGRGDGPPGRRLLRRHLPRLLPHPRDDAVLAGRRDFRIVRGQKHHSEP